MLDDNVIAKNKKNDNENIEKRSLNNLYKLYKI